jgi:hypothetical protein
LAVVVGASAGSFNQSTNRTGQQVGEAQLQQEKGESTMTQRKGDQFGDNFIEPVEFHRNAEGRPVVIKGYRRLQALRLLVQQGQHGFEPDMQIIAREVPKPTHDQKQREATDGE